MVGTAGFEPATSCAPCKHAARLRHVPTYYHHISLSSDWQIRWVTSQLGSLFEVLTLQPRFISRPFVSLTQDAKNAEKDKNKVKNKGNLLLKQSHFTAEGAEIAEKGMVQSRKTVMGKE